MPAAMLKPQQFTVNLPFEEKIKKNFKDKNNYKLMKAFLFGDYKKISADQKLKYKLLNLYHLLTPSGLHFTAALTLLMPLKYLFKTNGKLIYKIIFLLINFLSLFLPGFYPLKRIASINIFHYFLSRKINYSYFFSFILVSTLDFLFGTFKFSYLSFTYSFLFLGIVLTTAELPFFKRVILLFGGIFVVNFYSDSPILIGAIFCNSFLTLLFTLIFPFSFILYWIPFSWAIYSNEFLVNTFNNLVNISFNLLHSIGYSYSSIFLVIFFFSSSIRKSYSLIKISLVLIVIFHSVVLNYTYDPYNSHYFKNGQFIKTKNYNGQKLDLIKTLYTDYGFKFIYANDLICYLNFDNLEKTKQVCARSKTDTNKYY
ncbi:MAG: hypothetical protein U0T83_01865 [Bacteriovoracaceae bacterium]